MSGPQSKSFYRGWLISESLLRVWAMQAMPDRDLDNVRSEDAVVYYLVPLNEVLAKKFGENIVRVTSTPIGDGADAKFLVAVREDPLNIELMYVHTEDYVPAQAPEEPEDTVIKRELEATFPVVRGRLEDFKTITRFNY